jgi:RNA polymerase sigma factor (sigma-70 family)
MLALPDLTDSVVAPHAPTCASVGSWLDTDREPMAPAAAPSRESCEQLFLTHLRMIQGVAAAIARQHRLSPPEAEEFTADVQLRIIRDDYAVLRKFRGRCTLRTFLTVVIGRMCLDYRDAEWGKWRPSARSRRAGDVAVLLERLTVRDGLTFAEACTVIETNYHLTVERDTLERIHARFRARTRPRFVSGEESGDEPASPRSADDAVVGAEQNALVARATEALAAALTTIAPQDRLVLKLQFCDGLSVAAIARMLEIDHKELYRRLERLLGRLRAILESAGVIGPEVLAALGRSDSDLVKVFTLENVSSPDAWTGTMPSPCPSSASRWPACSAC